MAHEPKAHEAKQTTGSVMVSANNRSRRAFVGAVMLLLALTAPSLHAQPALFHDHGHGLAFSSDGKALLAPSHSGLAVYANGAWSEVAGPIGGFSGFSVTKGAIYASGHANSGVPSRHEPVGLMRSLNGGQTWQAIAPSLAGKADFRLISASYGSKAIYVANAEANAAMPFAGLYVTHDEGASWRHVTARGLTGEIHGIAAHPTQAGVIAVATGRGLYLSRDGGENFSLRDRKQPATAVTFDTSGKRMRYARALTGEVVEAVLEGRAQKVLRLPRLKLDYVTCLAQHPQDDRVLAFATRKRDVYLTLDGGTSWRLIAQEGVARGSTATERRKDDP